MVTTRSGRADSQTRSESTTQSCSPKRSGPRRRSRNSGSTDAPAHLAAAAPPLAAPSAARAAADASASFSFQIQVPASGPQLEQGEAAKALAYGVSVFPAIWANDTSSPALKLAILLTAAVVNLAVPFLPAAAAGVIARHGSGSSWDSIHGISLYAIGPQDMVELLAKALAIEPATSWLAVQVTAVPLGALALLDLARWLGGPAARRVLPDWPTSWECSNVRCYEEMFRWARLTRDVCLS